MTANLLLTSKSSKDRVMLKRFDRPYDLRIEERWAACKNPTEIAENLAP